MKSTIWSRIWVGALRPEALFTVAMLQGLSPYVFWQLGVGRAISSDDLTYIPVWIWIVGWLSFVAGAALVRRRLASAPRFLLSPRRDRIQWAIWIVLVVCVLQVYLLSRVYGGFPLLSYLSGNNQIDVVAANAAQDNSGTGQVALLNITIFILTALLVELAIVSIELSRKVPLQFVVGLTVAVLSSLLNGKRNGMFRIFIFVSIALLLYSKQAFKNLNVLVPFFKRSWAGLFLIIVVVFALFKLFGAIAVLRNQGRIEVSSTQEAVIYQEGPIINMELQTRRAGFGPGNFSLVFPLQQIIPFKWSEALGVFNIAGPPRVDPTSPAGFYELLQWSWGLPGIVAVSFFVGLFSSWLFKSCRNRVGYLLCYGQVAYSLLIAHSFNEFLIAPYVLVPCALMAVIGRLTSLPLRVVKPQAHLRVAPPQRGT